MKKTIISDADGRWLVIDEGKGRITRILEEPSTEYIAREADKPKEKTIEERQAEAKTERDAKIDALDIKPDLKTFLKGEAK